MRQEQVFYRGLSAKQMEAMRHCGHYLEKRAGELIFHEGDKTEAFYVVLKGEVQTFRSRKEGETLIARLGEGDVLGLAGMLEYQQFF